MSASTPLRILGVDPGLARTGVAVIAVDGVVLRLVHASCIETFAGEPEGERLAALFTALTLLVRTHRPTEAAVEQLFFAANHRSAMQVAQARGVAVCVLAREGLRHGEYTPLQVKESVAGFGAAEKPQVARMVCRLLDVERVPGPDDVTDACAIAITHQHRMRLGAVGLGTPASIGGGARLAGAVAAALRAQRT